MKHFPLELAVQIYKTVNTRLFKGIISTVIIIIMVATYCARERKRTTDVRGSQHLVTTKNGRMMVKSKCGHCGAKKTRFVKSQSGGKVDLHKLIGKLPKPKAGFTPGKYKYMGPYNPLEKQLQYDKTTGKVTKWHVKPHNKVDEISAYHDICYDRGRSKRDCDKTMVQSLDAIPYGKMPRMGMMARRIINTKQRHNL